MLGVGVETESYYIAVADGELAMQTVFEFVEVLWSCFRSVGVTGIVAHNGHH